MIEEIVLEDNTKVYRYVDGSYYKRVFITDERTVSELCEKNGYSNWNEEYSRPINQDFHNEYPNPQDLDHSSSVPMYLLLSPARKNQINTYIRNVIMSLLTGVSGSDTAEFGAREPGAPTTIRTYEYTATFSRTLTTAEKASLNNLEWAVRIEDSSGTMIGSAFIQPQKGITVKLAIKYDYAERTIYVGPVINGMHSKSKSKMTTVSFSVPLVPEIMDRIHAAGTATTIYPVAAALQRKWFNTPGSSVFTENQSDMTKSFDTALVTLDWVRGFTRGKAIYDRLMERNYWFSSALKETLLTRFETNSLLGQSSTVLWAGFPSGHPPLSRLPDPAVDMRLFNACYEQHLAWTNTQTDPNDDLKATLANCDWRIAFEGRIEPMDADKKQLVTITRMGVYIRDSFDYVGEQFGGLGDWRAHPPSVASEVWGGGYTDVDNAMYRNWRTANGIGHDFLVFSNVEFSTPTNPVPQFRILESATWMGLGSRIEDV